jgi:GT2 family glycosyltransferase
VQTIVIDNCSSDDTVRFIKANYPEVIVIENQENQGFGKANNIGIKYALDNKADYIYLLNQDAWIDSNAIEGLAGLMEKNKQYGIVSPLQYTGNGKNLDKNFQHLLSPNICKNILNDLVTNDLKSELYPASFVMAAHWMIRTVALEDTGGFLPLFKHYGEDKDLINRMLFYGWRTGITPCFKGYHDREHRKETDEVKMQIKYTSYLANSSNINKPVLTILRAFKSFLIATFRSKLTVSKKMIYLYKALISIIPIIKYRNYSKNTKNKHFRWN